MRGNRNGFTLIEMLVVVALFSLLIVVIVNVYLLALSAQRQAIARQTVTSNIRYIMEVIAHQVRTGEIDYSAAYMADGTAGIQGGERELSLRDADGNTYSYFVNSGQLLVAYNSQVAALTDTAAVKIVDATFYIDPPTDPFNEERCNDALALSGCLTTVPQPVCTVNDATSVERLGFCQCTSDSQCASQHCDVAEGICLPFDRQPRVTMAIGVESASVRDIEVKRLYIQTTVTSRIYRR